MPQPSPSNKKDNSCDYYIFRVFVDFFNKQTKTWADDCKRLATATSESDPSRSEQATKTADKFMQLNKVLSCKPGHLPIAEAVLSLRKSWEEEDAGSRESDASLLAEKPEDYDDY